MGVLLFAAILLQAFQSALTFRIQPLPWSALRCTRLHAEPLIEDAAMPVLMTITLSVTDSASAESHQVTKLIWMTRGAS